MRHPWTVICAAAAWAVAIAAGATEIKILTAGAFKPMVMALVPEFERQTGHKLTVENDTAGALVRRIGNGEAFDIVVLTQDGMAPLIGNGKVDAGTAVRLARVGIGVAAQDGPAAQAFLALLGSARARDGLRDKGMEAP